MNPRRFALVLTTWLTTWLTACQASREPLPAAAVTHAVSAPTAARTPTPIARSLERDQPPSQAGRWPIADGAHLELAGGGVLTLTTAAGGTARWSEGVVGLPSLDARGERVVYAERRPGEHSTVLLARERAQGWEKARVLVQGGGNPDRVSLAADGARVAFVSGKSGLASLWAVPFVGGAPVQLTNGGVEKQPRAPGLPPFGFVPPPHREPPRWEGKVLRWTSPAGEHEVALP